MRVATLARATARRGDARGRARSTYATNEDDALSNLLTPNQKLRRAALLALTTCAAGAYVSYFATPIVADGSARSCAALTRSRDGFMARAGAAASARDVGARRRRERARRASGERRAERVRGDGVPKRDGREGARGGERDVEGSVRGRARNRGAATVEDDVGDVRATGRRRAATRAVVGEAAGVERRGRGRWRWIGRDARERGGDAGEVAIVRRFAKRREGATSIGRLAFGRLFRCTIID